jgi:hypothetical protein
MLRLDGPTQCQLRRNDGSMMLEHESGKVAKVIAHINELVTE